MGSASTFDIVFLIVLAFVAWHALRPRGQPRERDDWPRLLFGCIALTFFLLVFFQDILGLSPWGAG